MSDSRMGAIVQYCGHDGHFIADIYKIGNTNVINASQPVTMNNLRRPARGCTHHISDFPTSGFWQPRKGLFVIPEEQCIEIEPEGK